MKPLRRDPEPETDPPTGLCGGCLRKGVITEGVRGVAYDIDSEGHQFVVGSCRQCIRDSPALKHSRALLAQIRAEKQSAPANPTRLRRIK